MQSAMLQFRHSGPAPSMEEVRRLFDLRAGEIDPEFGVISTDPREGIYAVLVAASARDRVAAVFAGRPPDPAEGLFANPPIDFLPPRREK